MTAEVVPKKRGRPRKVVETVGSTSTDGKDVSSTATATKSNSGSRAFSSAEARAKSTASKKPARRKQTIVTEGERLVEVEVSKTPSASRSKIKEKKQSSVPDEATAFTRRKQEKQSQAAQLASTTVEQAPSSTASSSGAETHPQQVLKAEPAPRSRSPATEPVSRAARSSELPAAIKGGNSGRSSFLSSFLDDNFREPSPVVSEDSKISDRSAFNASKISIDDIVGGAGVTDLSSFPEPKPSTIQVRKPAIPISETKAFKGYNVKAFADARQTKPREILSPKATDPAAFATSSFSAFRVSQPLCAPATRSGSGELEASPADESTTMQDTTSEPRLRPQHASISESESRPQNTPAQASRTQPISQPSQPSPTRPVAPSSQPRPSPAFQAPLSPQKRPTEMTREELLKNPRFKTLRRSWTGLIVGIPIFVVSSYMLYKRLGSEADPLGSIGAGGELSTHQPRMRGVVPPRVGDGLKDRE